MQEFDPDKALQGFQQEDEKRKDKVFDPDQAQSVFARQGVAVSAKEGLNKSAQETANIIDLTEKSRFPKQVVQTDPKAVQKIVKEREVADVAERDPVLGQWMTDPENLSLIQDDLGFWGAVGNTLKRGGLRSAQMAVQIAAETSYGLAKDKDKSFGEILGSEHDKMMMGQNPLLGLDVFAKSFIRFAQSRIVNGNHDTNAKDLLGTVGKLQTKIGETDKSEPATRFQNGVMNAQGFSETMEAVFFDPIGAMAFAAEVGGEMFPQLIAGGVATYATKNPSLGASFMGGLSGLTERYTSPAEYLSHNGFDLNKPEDLTRLMQTPDVFEDAQNYGFTRGAVIGAFDTLSGKAASVAIGKPLVNFISQLFIQAGFGGAGEGFAQLATGDDLDAGEIILEAVGEFATAPIEVVTVGGQYFMQQNEHAKAKKNKEKLEETFKLLEQAKIFDQSDRKGRELFQSIWDGTNKEDIKVSASGLASALVDTVGPDLNATLDALGIDKAVFDEAVSTGNDIDVKAGEVASILRSDEGVREALLMNVRVDDQSQTMTEAESGIADIKAQMDKQFAEKQDDANQEQIDFRPEDAVFNFVRDMLVETGRYNKQQAEVNADIWRYIARTRQSIADKNGQEYNVFHDLLSRGLNVQDEMNTHETNVRSLVLDRQLNAIRKRKNKGELVDLFSYLERRGKVATGSDLALSLQDEGVNPKTHKSLFSEEGKVTELGNIIAEDFNEEFRTVAQDDGKGYVDSDWLMDRIKAGTIDEIEVNEVDQLAKILEKQRMNINDMTNEEIINALVGGNDISDVVDEDGRVLNQSEPLPDLEAASDGPIPAVVAMAEKYAEVSGIEHGRQARYVAVDVDLAGRIATAFEEMADNPTDPEVKAAYAQMIEETIAQFHVIQDSGLVIEFIPSGENPYPDGPKMAIDDMRDNNHLWVFPTEDGFGTINEASAENPLLQETDISINGHKLVANDVFRIVHGVFGHGLEGARFGPRGEENAWQAHVRMYSPLAARAMTTETRGQNSWLNFGPHGEHNRANPKETIYADQKIGLLPEWASTENIVEDQENVRGNVRGRNGSERALGATSQGQQVSRTRSDNERIDREGREINEPPLQENGRIRLVHFSEVEGITETDPDKYGTNPNASSRSGERVRKNQGGFTDRTYFAIGVGMRGGYKHEAGIGPIPYETEVSPKDLYNLADDPLRLRSGELTVNEIENAVVAAGFKGYWMKDPSIGMVAAVFEKMPVTKAEKANDDRVLYQTTSDAQRNSIGLYSAVEQAALDMNIPSFKASKKNPDGRANGTDIWAKIKGMQGVKAEELKWLGLEEFLKSGEKYTRDEVTEFIQKNGVVVEGVIADDTDSGGYEVEWDEPEVWDEDEAWEYRVEDYVDEPEMMGWNDVVETEEIINGIISDEKSYIENAIGEDATDEQRDAYVRENFQDEISNALDEKIREAAEEYARTEYEENPIYVQHASEESIDLIIFGNDDQGYDVRTDMNYSSVVASDIWSQSEAQIQAQDFARVWDLIVDEESPTRARWGGEQYNMEGDYENYRELKLSLPNVLGSFVEDAHFSDDNIVTWLRVDDRKLPVGEMSEEGKQKRKTQIKADIDALNESVEAITPEVLDAKKAEIHKILEDAVVRVKGKISERDQIRLNDYSSWEVLGREVGIGEEVAGEYRQMRLRITGNKDIIRRLELSSLRDEPTEKNAYFIDEFQSDWHQDGRQKGYSTGEDAGLLEATIGPMNEERNKFVINIADRVGLSNIGVLEILNGDKNFKDETIDAVQNDPEYKLLQTIQKQINETQRRTDAERYGVPDAPFKGNAWMMLGLKRAIVDAVENGYEAIAWPNANVMTERWSENYRTLYETQYDTKMPPMVGKLLGDKKGVKEFTLDGDPIDRSVRTYDQIQKELEDFDKYPQESDARNALMAEQVVAPDTEHTLGYHIIELTPEMIEEVKNKSFPLFQNKKEGVRGKFSPDTNTITLTALSDKTTFMHESAHFFLEWVNDMASDEDAPAEILAMRNGIFEIIGAKVGGEIPTNAHEIFAESFEEYLKTGKAPSKGLRRSFAMFRKLFVTVYNAMTAKGGNALERVDPELFKFFDRLLASEEEISEAEAETGLTIPAELSAIIDEEDQNLILEIASEMHEEGIQQQYANRLKIEKREVTKWWKRQFKEMKAQAKIDLLNSRPYRARHFLRTGEFPTGETPANLKDTKMSTIELNDIFGDGITETLRYLVNSHTKKKGAHVVSPDAMADMLGYSSFEEMYNETKDAQGIDAAARKLASERMKERHGDPLNDGSIEESAMAHVAMNKRATFLEAQLKALSKKSKSGTPTPLSVIRSTIQGNMEGKPLQAVLTAKKFLQASIRAGKRAEKAIAAGDLKTAFEEKQRQLVNYEMYRHADFMKRRVEIMDKRLKRRGKKGIDPSYINPKLIEAIKSLLPAYGYGNPINGQDVQAGLTRVNEIIADHNASAEKDENAGVIIDILPWVTDAANAKEPTQLAFEQMVELDQTVTKLWNVGRGESLFSKAEIAEKRAEYAEEIRMNNPTRKAYNTRKEKDRYNKGDDDGNVSITLSNIGVMLQRMPHILKFLSPKLHRDIMERFDHAAAKEQELTHRVIEGLREAFKKYSLTERTTMDSRVLGLFYIDELGESWSKEDILSLVMQWGTQSNRDAVIGGDPRLNEAIVQAIFDKHLTKRDLDFVQEVFDVTESLWPEISELEKSDKGVLPEKLDATPITTAAGSIAGGYMRLKYSRDNPKGSNVGDKDVATNAAKWGSATASTKNGSTIERVAHTGMEVRLDFGVIFEHLQESITDISYRHAVRYASKLLISGDVATAIAETMGQDYNDLIKQTLKNIARNDVTSDGPASNFFRSLRINNSIAIMTYNLKSAVSAPSGIFQGMVELGAWPMVKSMAEFTNPKRAWETIKRINELSDVMNVRSKIVNRDLRQTRKKIGKGILRAQLNDYGYYPLVKIDKFITAIVWNAAEKKALAEGKSQKQAIFEGNQAVSLTQSSGSLFDISPAESGGELFRTLTFLYNYMGSTYNLTRGIIRRTGRDYKNADGIGKAAIVGKAGVDLALLHIAQMMVYEMIVGNMPDDDDEKLNFFLWGFANQVFGMIPILSGAVRSAEFGLSPQTLPADSMMRSGTRFIQSAADDVENGELSRDTLRSAAMAIGAYKGIPATFQALKIEKGVNALSEGEDVSPWEMFVSGVEKER